MHRPVGQRNANRLIPYTRKAEGSSIGVKVYDARLVAIMSVYTVESVLTFNVSDFERFDGTNALHPTSIPV
jgi:hypothetical protein